MSQCHCSVHHSGESLCSAYVCTNLLLTVTVLLAQMQTLQPHVMLNGHSCVMAIRGTWHLAWLTSGDDAQLDNSHHAGPDVEKAARQVLKELQQDYLDLFLVHWPLVSGCKGDTLQPPIKARSMHCCGRCTRCCKATCGWPHPVSSPSGRQN